MLEASSKCLILKYKFMKKSKKYFVFGDHCTRGKTKLQWRHVCLMCVILLMLPFVGRAQQQKVSVRVNKAGHLAARDADHARGDGGCCLETSVSGESIRVHL